MLVPTYSQRAVRDAILRREPIPASVTLEGSPMTGGAELSRSPDKTTCTVVWDCTAGKFVWDYFCDETILILEGTVAFTDEAKVRTVLEVGDTAFFPKGCRVVWEVDRYVKKLAFLRTPTPPVLLFAYNRARDVRNWVRNLRGGFRQAVP